MQLTTLGNATRSAFLLVTCLSLAGCGVPSMNAKEVEGPAIVDVVTPFDLPLACLNKKIDGRLTFGVGGIPDTTGRTQNSTEGAGAFVTQGAGDIVQSALFKAGVTVINRRDMGSAVLESQWGLRNLQGQLPANFIITGSINSLDFIPGGGSYVNIAGFGPRYRQNRILVGMDLALTNNATGQIVANIALRKQIFADEMGLMAASFVEETIVDIDLGVARREAVHFALRNMLQLATFELLTQLMPYEAYAECHALVDPRYGAVTGDRTTAEQEQMAADRAAALAAAEAAANGVEQTTLPPPAQPEEEVSAGAAAANADGVLPENDPSQTVGGG